MMSQIPKVSVIVPCYNHENFIATAIDSVLNQTYKDYELIVCDNGSTDRSREIIESYGNQINLIKMDQNNPPKCTRKMLDEAKGEYVAILCSDDYWYPQKLEKQILAMEKNPECQIFFAWAEMVDDKMKQVINQSVFISNNKSRYEWLKEFLFKGTVLEFSSLLIKNDSRYQKYYADIERFRQLPDLKLYINMVMEEPIYTVEEILVKHRMHGSNVSGISKDTSIRTLNEQAYIIYETWKNISEDVFINTFMTDLKIEKSESDQDILCQKMLLYLHLAEKRPLFAMYALSFFWENYMKKGISELLNSKYGFSVDDISKYSCCIGAGNELYDKQLLYLEKMNGYSTSNNEEIKKGILEFIKCNDKIIELSGEITLQEDIFEAIKESFFSLKEIMKNMDEDKVCLQADLVMEYENQIIELEKSRNFSQKWSKLITLTMMIQNKLKQSEWARG